MIKESRILSRKQEVENILAGKPVNDRLDKLYMQWLSQTFRQENLSSWTVTDVELTNKHNLERLSHYQPLLRDFIYESCMKTPQPSLTNIGAQVMDIFTQEQASATQAPDYANQVAHIKALSHFTNKVLNYEMLALENLEEQQQQSLDESMDVETLAFKVDERQQMADIWRGLHRLTQVKRKEIEAKASNQLWPYPVDYSGESLPGIELFCPSDLKASNKKLAQILARALE